MSYMKTALVIEFESTDNREQFIEDFTDDICNWDFLNKNEKLDTWRATLVEENNTLKTVVLFTNGIPDVDWEKYVKAYKEFTYLKISKSNKYVVEVIPYLYEQNYMKASRRVLLDYQNDKSEFDKVFEFSV
ncbi:hypothetical protein N2W52_002070 [Clostridium perfringens]|nr:hypothetical protein [Clostridium perfringens]